MTSATAIPRYIHCMVFLIVSAGCLHSRATPPVAAVDLIREFDSADKRPPVGSSVAIHEIDGITRPAIVVPVPSRMTWPLSLPRDGVFRAFVASRPAGDPPAASAVRLRVGISDHRIYEGLSEVMLTPDDRKWTELRADLSAYAGWQWSLFYRPDRIAWRLVLAADATGAAPAIAMWASPEVLTDTESAREYATRRRQLPHP